MNPAAEFRHHATECRHMARATRDVESRALQSTISAVFTLASDQIEAKKLLQKRASALRVRPDGFRRGHDSEYPAVVIPVMTQHYAMLQQSFSTPVSHAASGWSCWSSRRRPSPSAVRNVSGRRRWSKLGEWLPLGNRSTPGHSSKP